MGQTTQTTHNNQFLKSTAMNTRLTSAIALIATGLALSLSSCKDPVEDLPPAIILEEDKLEAEASGGTLTVSYTVENPCEGEETIPGTEADWLGDFNTSQPGTVSFEVAANYEKDPRQASVTLTYGKASATFTVTQKGFSAGTDPDAEIYLEIKEIGIQEVRYDVTPKDKEMTYIAMVVEQSYMDNFGSDEEYFQDDLNYFNMFASLSGKTLEEYLRDILFKGDIKDMTIGNLKPQRDYYLYSYGLSLSAEMTTEIFRLPFTTRPVDKVDITFDIECLVDGPSLTMTVTPSDNSQGYYFDAVAKRTLEEEQSTIAELVQAMLDEQIAFGQVFGSTIEEILASILSYGKDSASEFALRAETDYIGFAVAVNEKGLVCSDTAEKDFTTGKVAPSDNKITLSISNVGIDQIDYTLTTTNNDPYVFAIDAAGNWAGMSDEQILDKITLEYDLSYNVRNGNESGTIEELEPNMEYIAMAFGYNAGTATTALTKATFKTLEAGDPSKLTFTFEITDITDTSATISATGDPANATFYLDLADASMSGEDILEEIEDEISFYLEYGWIISRQEYWKGELSRGTGTYEYEGLPTGQEYRAYAFGVYEDSGEIATDVFFSEPFTTGEGTGQPSEDAVTLVADKHFDIIELAELYPDLYADYAFEGYCVYPVKIEAASDIQYTYIATLFEDAMSKTDAEIIEQLSTSGSMDKEIHFMLPYDTDITVVAVGEYSPGEYSGVVRKLIRLTKENASPASEYVPKESASEASFTSPRKAAREKSVRENSLRSVSGPSAAAVLKARTKDERLTCRRFDYSAARECSRQGGNERYWTGM